MTSSRILVAELFDHYWREHAVQLRSCNVIRSQMKPLKRELGSITLGMLNDGDIARYTKKRAKLVSGGALRNELMLLRTVQEHCVIRKHIRRDEVVHVNLVQGSQPRQRVLTKNEARLLLQTAKVYDDMDACPANMLLYVALLMFAGQRPNVVRDLLWTKVFFSTSVIDFRPEKSRGNKRYSRVRMMPELRDLLVAAYPYRTTAYVIGKRCTLHYHFAKIVQLAGLEDVTPYTLRHTYITWSASEGVPMQVISSVVGTSEAQLSRSYVHLTPDFQQSAAERVWFDETDA